MPAEKVSFLIFLFFSNFSTFPNLSFFTQPKERAEVSATANLAMPKFAYTKHDGFWNYLFKKTLNLLKKIFDVSPNLSSQI